MGSARNQAHVKKIVFVQAFDEWPQKSVLGSVERKNCDFYGLLLDQIHVQSLVRNVVPVRLFPDNFIKKNS